MKGKIAVILLLVALLAFIVYKMMQHETDIREQRVTKEYIEEDSGPLLEKKPLEELQRIAADADYYFRADGDYFKILDYGYQKTDRHWKTFLMKGVNMGVALPGKFPAEFSMTYEEYMDWLIKIGKMNSNVLRIYTILPPEFYEAFAQYNLHHQDRPLYLLHGVWAKVPPNHDYFDPAYTRDFKKEIIDVIDVLHGNTVLDAEKGKASGVYAVDVSEYVAGIILGREWEPNAVHKTNNNQSTNQYYGEFVSMPHGNPMEAWLAEIMDFTALYELQAYGMQHPLSFVNWLPLDPMYHNTEFIENEKVREFDNDLEAVHFENFHSSKMFIPGIFASYHAYPYYPDYVYLKEKYATAKNSRGKPDNYIGYLRDLKSRHKGMPLLIAEYGVPSSRGNSHVNPFGFDQGGHSEAEQAEISMMLTRDIFHSGCAGAVYFEWADEWFKHNWLVMGFEKPFHDRKLWHNMENPEQNFGILALENRQRTIDGELDDWDQSFKKSEKEKFQYHADASYFYIGAILEDFDFRENNLYIAIDTYDREKGDHRLPFSEERFRRGFEFLVEMVNKDSAAILVDEPYSVFTDIYNDSVPVYASKPNENGEFVRQKLLTNRGRESLTGETFDSVIVDRSELEFGLSNQPETSNADWYWNSEKHELELRLTWHLLNVSDPAKNYVLDDQKETAEIEYTRTDGFNLIGFITDKENNVIRRFPDNGTSDFIWEQWQQPDWTSRMKPLYDSLKHYFRVVNSSIKPDNEIRFPEKESFRITEFYRQKQGAVSHSFLGSDYSQIEQALPVLDKYRVSASFGVVPDLINDVSGRYAIDEAGRRKRFSSNDLKMLSQEGHSVVLQLTDPSDVNAENYPDILKKEEMNPNHLIAAYPAPSFFDQKMDFIRTPDIGEHSYSGLSYHNLESNRMSQPELDSVFAHGTGKWFIPNYKYLSNGDLPERGKSLFVRQKTFENQLRLARNHNYWLANEWKVFKYLTERQHSEIETSRHGNQLFVSLKNALDNDVFDHPLTIAYQTPAPFVQVVSEKGQFTLKNRTGVVYFDIVPGKEITLKQLW
ncbi:MAG: hypothetical protein ACQESX_03745 [Bacteroidota bacterium]